jgi:AAA family ATP:ADP antiporter
MPDPAAPAGSTLDGWLRRVVLVERHEVRALLWAFAYFFCVLSGYYVIRPMRETLGIAAGVENLHWLFTATFVAMLAVIPLFGWVTSRFPRRRFLPWVYAFFILHLLAFWALLQVERLELVTARVFYVWVSVFNLFVVSVFWSFMADLFTTAQAGRLFGFVAAGGTAGALAGPALAASLTRPLGQESLLLVSAALLAFAIVCIGRLGAWHDAQPEDAHGGRRAAAQRPLGGGVFSAIPLVLRSPYLLGIAAFVLLFTSASTILYFQQAEVVRDAIRGEEERTVLFAAVDLAVNALTLATQVFLTARLVRALGVGWTLALVPGLLGLGFLAIGLAPVLPAVLAVQIVRRAGEYAITRPAREVLYVVLGREEKYKAKNFVDTAVYRGGDTLSAWAFAGLRSLGLQLGTIALAAVPVVALWTWLAVRLGRRQEVLAAQEHEGGGERWNLETGR